MTLATLPTVSVIIPTYNRAQFIGETIASVLNQTFQDFELIIIDDGSTDHTREVFEIYRSDPKVQFVFKNHEGACIARNKGIELSRGKLIAFLDSDDIWLPDKLLSQVRFLDDHPEITLVHGCVEVIDSTGKFLSVMTHRFKKFYNKAKKIGEDYAGVSRLPFFFTSAFLIRREFFNQFCGFDPKSSLREDLDLCLRLTFEGHQMVCLEGEPVLHYRYRGNAAHIKAAVLNAFIYIYQKQLGALKASGRLTEHSGAHEYFLFHLANCFYQLNDFKACFEYSMQLIKLHPIKLCSYEIMRNLLISMFPSKLISILKQIKSPFHKWQVAQESN